MVCCFKNCSELIKFELSAKIVKEAGFYPAFIQN
jgi:hypothetical protein